MSTENRSPLSTILAATAKGVEETTSMGGTTERITGTTEAKEDVSPEGEECTPLDAAELAGDAKGAENNEDTRQPSEDSRIGSESISRSIPPESLCQSQQCNVGCVITSPGYNLTEAVISTAWKEYHNAFTRDREIHLDAQAVDIFDYSEIDQPASFTMTVNEISHGGVPGRTICFAGYVIGKIPKTPVGGLCPLDQNGWTNAERLWIHIVYDTYDQVGCVLSYANAISKYDVTPATGVSSALNPTPMMPPV